MRNAMMTHFGDFDTTDTTNPEDQAIHASIAEKLKPITRNETSLIINELDPKTRETTGKQSAKQESPLQPLSPQNQPQATTATFAGNSPLPENEKPLIINELDAKTPETTGNKPENLETLLEGLRKAFLQIHPQQSHDELYPNTTSNTAPLPENETPLIINDLSSKTPETTGNEAGTQPLRLSLRSPALSRSENSTNVSNNASEIDPQYAGYPTSSTPPDPTVPYTYYSAKMLITKYPDGRIRYDYGGGRPAVTIKKGGPAILERRVFYI
jgi:hypothetical protein